MALSRVFLRNQKSMSQQEESKYIELINVDPTLSQHQHDTTVQIVRSQTTPQTLQDEADRLRSGVAILEQTNCSPEVHKN